MIVTGLGRDHSEVQPDDEKFNSIFSVLRKASLINLFFFFLSYHQIPQNARIFELLSPNPSSIGEIVHRII